MTYKLFLNELCIFLWKIFRFLLLIGMGFVIMYPVLYMFSTSIKPVEQLTDPSIVWLPRSITGENFKMAFDVMKYMEALINTLTIGGISSILQIISCAFIGYGFARFDFKLKGLAFAAVLFTVIVPPQTILIPLYLMYVKFSVPFIGPAISLAMGTDFSINMIDSNFSFYLPAVFGMGIRSGIYIYIFRQFFRGIPKELEEAATVDGCNAFTTFIRIMLPNATNGILTVFLFSFVWYWNDYFTTSIFLSTKQTLAVALTSLRANLSMLLDSKLDPYVMITRLQAGSLMVIAPILILYMLLQKYFTESIERTGIVG